MTQIRSAVQKIALFCGSLFFCLFLLFTVFEIFPALPARLHLTSIHYYALKDRYLSDDRLVLRMKPFYSYRGYFPGDIAGFKTKSAYKPLPYEANYDRNGFRNLHPDGQADIVVLGDSYMEVGLTDDDTFAAHLEKTSGFSAANYGMGWYGPFQYLETLKRYAVERKPKIALLSFFEGNDFRDTSDYLTKDTTGGYYEFSRYSGNFFQRFFLCVRDTIKAIGKFFVRRWDPRRAEIQLGRETFHTVFVYPVDTRLEETLLALPPAGKIGEIFAEFKRVCESNQIKPAIVFIPSKAHIYLQYALMPSVPNDSILPQLQNRSQMENAIHSLAESNAIPWLSLTPVFEKAAEEGRFVYYETDTHWNTEGRILAAQATAAFLKEKLSGK